MWLNIVLLVALLLLLLRKLVVPATYNLVIRQLCVRALNTLYSPRAALHASRLDSRHEVTLLLDNRLSLLVSNSYVARLVGDLDNPVGAIHLP